MITFNQNRKTRKSGAGNRQRGVALIAALLALVLVAAITAGMIILSTTETSISANFRDEQTAFFAAKAGMEEIRDRMDKQSPASLRGAVNLLPTTLPGTPNSVLYILNPLNGEVVAPWNGNNTTSYPDDEICKETTTIVCAVNVMTGQSLPSGAGWYTSTNANANYATVPVLPWKWVRVTMKQNNGIAQYATNGNVLSPLTVCWNGNNEYADAAYTPATGCTQPNLPIYIITALAVTPTGTRRMVQTEVAEDRFPFTTPSALTINGTGDTFGDGSSSQWNVNGNDSAGCGVAALGPSVHGIGVTDGSAGPPATGDVGNIDSNLKRPKDVTGAGGAPDVVNVSSTGLNTLPPNLQTVSSLQTLVSQLKADATQPVINGPVSSLSNPGTVGNPQIIYVNGDLTMSGNTQGYGILVVTGTLTMKGNVGWNGIVLVVGQGNLQTDGTVQYNGAVVVAKTLNTLGQPLPSVGPGTVDVNGGGNGGIQYSSGCINRASTLATFHVVSIRELMR